MSGIRVLAHFNNFRALDGGGDQGLAVQRVLRLLDQFDARVRRRVLRREDRAAILIRQGGRFKRADLLRALDDLALIHADGRAENRHVHHRVRAAENACLGEAKAFMIGMSVHAWMAWVALGLFVLAGLLLSLLASLVAVMLLKRRATKRMGVVIVIIIVVGILSASGGVAMMVGGKQLRTDEAQALIRTHKEALPELAGVKKLEAQAYSGSGTAYNDADEMSIRYVVTTGAPRYELRTQFEGKPAISVHGDTVRIALKSVGRRVFEYGFMQPELVIYGQALESIDVTQGNVQYAGLEGTKQERLHVSSGGSTNVVVFGSYENLAVQGGGDVDVSMSSVRNLSVDMQGGMTNVRAGVVYALSVTHPDVCPIQSADDQRPTVAVRSVSSGEVTYNGVTGPVVQRETPCGAVVIGVNTNEEGDYED